MSTLIHNRRRLTTGRESPGRPEPPELARNYLVVVGEEAGDPLPAEPRIQDGGDDGDNGDNHGAAMTTGDGGYGVIERDPGAIVDGVLADLPEPARHHILPKLEEFDSARPAI